MSRTRETEDIKQKNPAALFLRWSSENQCWEHYVKGRDGEDGHKDTVDVGTRFIVLDILTTVGGFDKVSGSRYWANEVRSMSDILTVQTWNKTTKGRILVTEGTWYDLKGDDKLKFTQSVYVAAKIGDELTLCNLQLSGCAVGAWFDFLEKIGGKSNVFGEKIISVTGITAGKTGAVKYNAPEFGVVSTSIKPETAKLADDMDAELQQYLDKYFDGTVSNEPDKQSTHEDMTDDEKVQSCKQWLTTKQASALAMLPSEKAKMLVLAAYEDVDGDDERFGVALERMIEAEHKAPEGDDLPF